MLKKTSDLIKALKRVPVTPDTFFNEIPKEMRQFAFTVKGIEQTSILGNVLDDLNKAIEDGVGYKEWARTVNIDKFKDLANYRKEVVYRTHANTSYNQGIRNWAEENKDINEYLRFEAVRDDKVRDNHLALDGITLPVNHEFWDSHTPPLGFNCRCRLLSLSKEEAAQGGSRTRVSGDFDKLSAGRTSSQLAKKIGKANPPDNGFRYNKKKPIASLSNYYRKKISKLPKKLKKSFLEQLVRRKILTEIWYNKNKKKFL